jgi:hypothetical protein
MSAMTTTGTCEFCGRLLSDFGCRPVPLGFWCLAAGLQQDPRTILAQSPDPMKAAVEQDRRVRSAQAGYDKAMSRADQARAEWERVVAAHAAADRDYRQNVREVVVGGELRSISPAGAASKFDVDKLAQEAEPLRESWLAAAKAAVKARDALESAKARVRHELATAGRT